MEFYIFHYRINRNNMRQRKEKQKKKQPFIGRINQTNEDSDISIKIYMEKLLYPPHISKRLVRTSVFGIIVILMAIIYECYFLAYLAVQTVIVSINYWRKPTL